MKKALIFGGVVVVAIGALLAWAMGMTSPDTAPTDVRVIDLPDTYEK